MGKLIYKPKGAAAEYCAWACNLYNGCTNGCTYCYNKRGVGCKLLGKEDVTSKGKLTDQQLVEQFSKELTLKRLTEIYNDGNELFFNFVSDPFLPETWTTNIDCIRTAINRKVVCRTLTKRAEAADYIPYIWLGQDYAGEFLVKKYIRAGFSLTGRDDLEPGASTNSERLTAMRQLHDMGVPVWASIEPVINLFDSMCMIASAYRDAGCREFKIGLLSGAKLPYSIEDIRDFHHTVNATWGKDCKIYWKESVRKCLDKRTI